MNLESDALPTESPVVLVLLVVVVVVVVVIVVALATVIDRTRIR